MAGRLTTIQQGIYLSCIANPSSTLYNLPYLGRFRDPVDPGKLRSALLAAAAAHPALNSVLRDQPDGSVILEEDSVPFDVPVTEVTGAEFEKLRGELVRPFDLAGGKLARIELYVTEDDLYIFEDMHHVIFDGTSMNVLADDVRRVLDGKQPEPETLTVYAAADEEAEWLESQGVNPSRIIVEDHSLTTAQNAIYTFDILNEQYPQVRQIAIISSDYHIATGTLLFGAEAILRSSDIEVVSNAAWQAPSGTLSAMFQAGALIELSGDVKTAFEIYYDTYDIHELPPLQGK